MGYLVASEIRPRSERVLEATHLGMGLKCLAMLNELLSLVGCPFELTDLCQLGTNLSDQVNNIRPESFYMLG